jgi:hypothetical protein
MTLKSLPLVRQTAIVTALSLITIPQLGVAQMGTIFVPTTVEQFATAKTARTIPARRSRIGGDDYNDSGGTGPFLEQVGLRTAWRIGPRGL